MGWIAKLKPTGGGEWLLLLRAHYGRNTQIFKRDEQHSAYR